MQNIFKLAEHEVANKSLITRLGHSAKFHATRSAVKSKGSFGSKLIRTLGTAGRAVVGCIPLPLVGGAISAAEKAIESKIRSKIHEVKRDSTENLRTHVKFALKEMSVENLDRFRSKLEFAVNDLNSAVAAHAATLDSYAQRGKPCNAFWELALAVAQAERRALRLMTACLEIETLMQMTRFMALKSSTGQTFVFPAPEAGGVVQQNSIMGIKKQMMSQYIEYVTSELENAKNFTEGQRGNVAGQAITGHIEKQAAGTKSNYQSAQNVQPQVQPASNLPNVHHVGALIGQNARKYAAAYHSECDDCCCFQDLQDPNETWDAFRNGVASLTNVLSVFSPTDFVSGITLPSGGAKTAFNWGEQ